MTDVVVRKRRRSALESFDGCPHRYNVLYNLCQCGHLFGGHSQVTGQCNDPLCRGCERFTPVEDRGDESQRGIAFHEAAFRYIDRLAQAGLEADAEEADLAFQEGIALTQLPFHLVDHVARLWRPFVEWFQLDLSAYLTGEQKQETDRFTWIPDLVYVRPQGVEITDWKTYYKGLTREQALKEFQLKFYLVHAMDLWPGFPTYTFTFNFVRLRYSVSISLTPDQVEAFRNQVDAIDLAMTEAERTSNYPAIPGSHCTLCRLACPLVDNPNRLPIRLATKQDAQDAFARVLVLEQELKTLKKSLEGWCYREGPLQFRGQEYAHRATTSRTFTVGDVRAVAGDAVDPIRVSTSALKPIWPRTVLIPQSLLDTGMATTKWAFKHRKAGENQPADTVDVLGSNDPNEDGGDDDGDD